MLLKFKLLGEYSMAALDSGADVPYMSTICAWFLFGIGLLLDLLPPSVDVWDLALSILIGLLVVVGLVPRLMGF
jgi:hypothetical protein